MREDFFDSKTWDMYQAVTSDDIEKNELILGKKFPETYKKLMLKFSGGSLPRICMLKVTEYPYPLSVDGFMSLKDSGGFNSDLGNCYSELHYEFANPLENMPAGILIFGGNGGGDFICFDYRNDPDTDNPPIVYWKHDAEPGKNIFFVANSFDEFLDMLYPYSE